MKIFTSGTCTCTCARMHTGGERGEGRGGDLLSMFSTI